MAWLSASVGTVILLEHMSKLEEWFLYHSVECDLFSMMYDYSDGVWLREMMQLMLSDDTDSDDVARELIYVIMR